MAKHECPLTRSQFVSAAKPMNVTIEGSPMVAVVKEFSTGSFGWYLNGKMTVQVGDKTLTVQVGGNLVVVGSKEAAKE